MRSEKTSFSQLYTSLNSKTGLDLDTVKKAFDFASHVHKNQEMKSGRKRLEHVVGTANIISTGFVDEETLAAAILHDSLGHGGVQKEELEKLFGNEITGLVGSFVKEGEIEETNLGKVDWELLTKIVLASAKDIRTIFIRIGALIDRLVWDDYSSNAETQKKALIAMNVYAPICHKLGLDELKWMLEDAAFKHIDPTEYNKIEGLVGESREARAQFSEKAGKGIESLLEAKKLNVVVQKRVKHFYSISKKMKKKEFENIYDLIGLRVICENTEDCYTALGEIDSKFSRVEHKFRDYIAEPKENGYRSIHTVALIENRPVEIQIRTWQMHWENEVGLAAHWQYKDFKKDKYFDTKLSVINQIMEWHKMQKDEGLLRQSLKTGSGEERVFVFSPKREVVILPEGSTPIDFAFAIHSDLGNRVKGAKVNGKFVPITKALANSDTIEIITAQKTQLKHAWLGFVKTEKARTKIKQALGIKDRFRKKGRADKLPMELRVRMSHCCRPLPGDEIVGYRTTKRKVSVHRANCKNIEKCDENRLVVVTWADAMENYSVELGVKAREDSSLLPEILGIFSQQKIRIVSTQAKTARNKVTESSFTIQIKSKGQLEKIVEKISKIKSVISVERI